MAQDGRARNRLSHPWFTLLGMITHTPITPDVAQLLEQRARHRRLLAGARKISLSGFPLSQGGPTPEFPQYTEERLRAFADAALDADLIAYLESNLEYIVDTDIRELVAPMHGHWANPIYDAIGPMHVTDERSRPAPDPDRMHRFVAAAVLADRLAGDYLDPRLSTE